MRVEQWARLFQHRLRIESRGPTPGFYEPLFLIFTQLVLPAINNRGGAQWKFKALIGWTGIEIVDRIAKEKSVRKFAFGDDLRQAKDSTARSKRNSTAKKRDANARGSRRRRQRNKAR